MPTLPTTAPTTTPPRDGLATVEQAAKFLHVCRTSVYAMMRDNELSNVKIRNARRIPWHELHKLAEGGAA